MNVSVEALESLLARARRSLRSAMSGADDKGTKTPKVPTGKRT